MKKVTLIVLIVIAVLLGYIAVKSERPTMYPSQSKTGYEKQKTMDENTKPIVIPKKEDLKIVTLKALVKKYPDGAISECNYQGDTYFSLYPNVGMADASTQIYTTNGIEIASGGGFVPEGTTVDPMYQNIIRTCTKVIYNSGAAGFGQADVYNLTDRW
jgi:hypothetical protein